MPKSASPEIAVINSTATPHKTTSELGPHCSVNDKLQGKYEFIPLEHETRPTVGTAAAAFYLRKAAQTMRIYACKENGPIRPIRIGAHLHWKTEDIRKLLGVA